MHIAHVASGATQQADRDTASSTVAVCDLGTYSGLILIARRSGRRWTSLLEERQTVDLLADSRRGRRLDRRASKRAARLLDRFEDTTRQFGDIKAAVVCTSAVRESVNRERFVASLQERTDYPVRVLSARKEAILSASGALIGLRPSMRRTTVVDIGGGSTEIVFLNGLRNRFWLTPWGAAKVTAAWKRSRAQSPDQWVESGARRTARILQYLRAPSGRPWRVVGVGGTIVTLAAIHAGLSEFDPRCLHGLSLRTNWILRVAERLARMNKKEITRLIPFDPDRARVLAAGTILWSGVLKSLAVDQVVVSVRGLRWGVAARLAGGQRI